MQNSGPPLKPSPPRFSTLYLQSAFDDVEWSDQEVSDAASQETSQAAERVELVAAEFAGIPVVDTICYTQPKN